MVAFIHRPGAITNNAKFADVCRTQELLRLDFNAKKITRDELESQMASVSFEFARLKTIYRNDSTHDAKLRLLQTLKKD